MKRFGVLAYTLQFLLGSLFWKCHKEGSEDLLFLLSEPSPVIAELEPPVGTPRQIGQRPYPPTQVRIRGKYLSSPSLEIRFNSIKAAIIYNTGREILTEVPDGATTGQVFARKPNGICIPNTNSGIDCSGKDFFVDCYSPYNQEFGKEIFLPWSTAIDYEFRGIETRAFRVEIPDFIAEGTSKVNLNCPDKVTVRYFSPSCGVTDLISVSNPQIPIPQGRIVQFFVTSVGGTCSLRSL